MHSVLDSKTEQTNRLYLQTTLSLLYKIAVHFAENFLRRQREISAVTSQNGIQRCKIAVTLRNMMKVIRHEATLYAQ